MIWREMTGRESGFIGLVVFGLRLCLHFKKENFPHPSVFWQKNLRIIAQFRMFWRFLSLPPLRVGNWKFFFIRLSFDRKTYECLIFCACFRPFESNVLTFAMWQKKLRRCALSWAQNTSAFGVTLQRSIPLIAPEAPTALVPGAPEPRM